MECSPAHGSRNDHDADEESRARVDYQDVTPAAFIFFAPDGIRDKSFVIDHTRATRLLNQPANAYRSKFKPLYETNEEGVAEPVKTELKLTKYDYGHDKVNELGERDVYPVSVKTTMWSPMVFS